MRKDFSLEIDELKAEHSRACMTIEFTADGGEVLDHFALKEIVEHFGYDELLDLIGEDQAREHFGIE